MSARIGKGWHVLLAAAVLAAVAGPSFGQVSLRRPSPGSFDPAPGPSPAAGDPFDWPDYRPNLSHHFRIRKTEPTPPTKVLNDVSNVAGTVTSGWWCFRYGPNKNPLVTDAAWLPLLDYMNQEFAYLRNVMGWPPDKRARNGYYSTIYLYGSGLSTDSASNTDLGGWQGSVYYQGQNWPMVLISYYPVYSFDPACNYSDRSYQRGGVVHEGVHCILADMPGCKQAAWFHEGGSNWILGEANAMRANIYGSMGWLSAGTMLAPFIPIECYSGWLQDGSFGGPSAEGVNRYVGGVQTSTWRNMLGGVQYSEAFPHFLGETVSSGSIQWIWQNCTGRVLEGLANVKGGLGVEQTRRLITEFRARQAMCDFGKWSPAYKKLLNDTWGITIAPEGSNIWIPCDPWTATCYVATQMDATSRTLTPEERTLPGWSGANQIPLKVSGTGTVSVDFAPIGANMVCQLVYRATDGGVIYSQPVSSGPCSLTLTRPPKNNVVVAVVSNTNYVYLGDTTRKAKYDYRLTLGNGITGTADINTKWWQ